LNGRRTAKQPERDAHALELRRRGATYAQIGTSIGVSAPAARSAVQRALAQAQREDASAAVALELERIDELIRVTLRVLAATHYVVSTTGKIVYGPDGEPLEDPAPRLAAVARLQSLGETRRKLAGLDAPRKAVVNVITETDIAAAIAAKQQELAEVERELAAIDARNAAAARKALG